MTLKQKKLAIIYFLGRDVGDGSTFVHQFLVCCQICASCFMNFQWVRNKMWINKNFKYGEYLGIHI